MTVETFICRSDQKVFIRVVCSVSNLLFVVPGTDLDEDIHGWSTVHSAHGYHGNHANNGRSRVVSDDETLFSRFSSFLGNYF